MKSLLHKTIAQEYVGIYLSLLLAHFQLVLQRQIIMLFNKTSIVSKSRVLSLKDMS